MHIFTFSPRAGTKAASLPDQVDKKVKKARSREMHELAVELKRQALARHAGATVPVLWEQQDGNGKWTGYTPHYHRVICRNSNIKSSELRRVKIDRIDDAGLVLVGQDAGHSQIVDFNQ